MPVTFKDPVCGMTVEPGKAAAQGEYGGQTLYFCSTSCKAKYDRAHSTS
jgi:P-type Cu+ transporter